MANGTNNRRAGRIYFKVDGTQYDAKGKFSYNLGLDKREAIVGADGVHGYKSTPQVAHVEGAITDSADLDLATFQGADNVTVTLELANGKVIVLSNAWPCLRCRLYGLTRPATPPAQSTAAAAQNCLAAPPVRRPAPHLTGHLP